MYRCAYKMLYVTRVLVRLDTESGNCSLCWDSVRMMTNMTQKAPSIDLAYRISASYWLQNGKKKSNLLSYIAFYISAATITGDSINPSVCVYVF